MTRPELRDIESLVGRLEDLTSTGGTIAFSSDTGNRLDSHPGHQQKKTANLTTWLQSDYSIFDSQPQTAKVKKEQDIMDASKDKLIDQFKMQRTSMSEKNILAALKSPIVQDTKKSTSNLQSDVTGHLLSTSTKLQISPQPACQMPVTAVKKKEKRKDKLKKSPSNAFATGTFDDRGKKSIQQGQLNHQGKETDRDNAKQKRKARPKSRDGSLKFLSEKVQNVFGEKFSMITASGLGHPIHSHRRHINQGLTRRDKSMSKDKRTDV